MRWPLCRCIQISARATIRIGSPLRDGRVVLVGKQIQSTSLRSQRKVWRRFAGQTLGEGRSTGRLPRNQPNKESGLSRRPKTSANLSAFGTKRTVGSAGRSDFEPRVVAFELLSGRRGNLITAHAYKMAYPQRENLHAVARRYPQPRCLSEKKPSCSVSPGLTAT